ncbi:YvbH-like oligomerisation region [Paenibacillus sp. UNCCL117]|uniref:PH domain-containing protein n=1 Tax=unclassified Paenibacillus TaxID=185978 RepID=UPI000887A7FC|nr:MULTISPECIES: PH domain-containing protein [unclassified Paenibacillus]SDE18647.1 YvbH-like oligomerisation region [Paenibacillus sp. cl123]SFW62171.1 YvbH-like oligomerisation region [Paenibacillus sp. UNCCL117]
MFKKLAADALGLSDIGKVIDRKDFDKVDADDYVMHEDGEKIYFIIKSKKDEYCFTNLALIHLDGDSAISSKRILKRYSYSANEISQVYMETAGTVDLDVEIKFQIGSANFSIDVDKRQIEPIKDLYKTLLKISEIVATNDQLYEYAVASVQIAKESTGRISTQSASAAEQFSAINEAAYNWLKTKHAEHKIKDFGFVFEKYINQ